jgi:hypothetical protein
MNHSPRKGEVPSAAKPQPIFGISLAKTQRSQRMVIIIGENILSFPSELCALAPWREEFPNPRTFDVRNIQAARYDKHVAVSSWIAIRKYFFASFAFFAVK